MSRPEPGPGDTVGKYVIESVLGRGGMGAVFRARHQITDRTVALKWLLEDDESRRRRFLREAKAMGRLSHPNVVGVLDVGDHDGAIYLVMDFVEGETLREHMDEHELEPAEAVALLLPGMSGVAAAHQAGILHRDLKPENLFVCKYRDGTAFDTKVLDFGVAKALHDEASAASLTHSGAIVGTPKYMAPEQLGEEQDLDARCDVYALGLIMFEMLTGRLPYRSTTLNKLFLEILTADLPRATEFKKSIPEDLADVVQRALARDPVDRWEDVTAFAMALEPFGAGTVFSAPRSVHTPDGAATGDALRAATGELVRPAKPGRVQTGDRRTDASAETIAADHSLASSVDNTPAPALPTSNRRRWIGAAVASLALAALAVGIAFSGGPAEVSPVREAATPPEAVPAETESTEPDLANVVPPEATPAEPAQQPSATPTPPQAPDPPAVVVEPTPAEGTHRRPPRRIRPRARPTVTPETPPPPVEEPQDSVVRVQTRAGVISADDF